eukprot:SAG11_NODE_740_length_7421_cov_6.264818_5_plen_117_part_00
MCRETLGGRPGFFEHAKWLFDQYGVDPVRCEIQPQLATLLNLTALLNDPCRLWREQGKQAEEAKAEAEIGTSASGFASALLELADFATAVYQVRHAISLATSAIQSLWRVAMITKL